MSGLDKYKGEFVYRLLRPDESPYKDIVSKDPRANRKISQHVKEGLKIPTQFISTTASFQAAVDWIGTSHACRPSEYSHLERRNTIVKISVKYIRDRYPAVADSAYNFTDDDFRCKHLVGVQNGYASRYQEVDFERTIPKEAITDVHVVGKGWIGLIPPVAEKASTPASKVANTGIKRKLSSEDYVPPSKCKRNEEQVSGSEWLSVCLVGK